LAGLAATGSPNPSGAEDIGPRYEYEEKLLEIIASDISFIFGTFENLKRASRTWSNSAKESP
jgi:hypothetical protein